MSDESDVPSNPDLLKLMQASMDNDTTDGGYDKPIELSKPLAKPEGDEPEVKAETNSESEKPAESDGVKVEGETADKPDGSLKESDKSEDKAKSKYAQEQERLNLTWTKVNERKAELEARERDWAKQRDEEQRRIIQSQPFRDKNGHSAADYAEFAKAAHARGEIGLAQQAQAAADQVYGQEVQARQQATHQQLQADWIGSYEKLAQEHPELGDQNSEMFASVKKLVAENPLLSQHASGASLAVEAVLVRKQYLEAQSILEENKKLKSQLAEANKNLSLSSGVAHDGPKADKSFADKTEKQQRRELLELLTADSEN